MRKLSFVLYICSSIDQCPLAANDEFRHDAFSASISQIPPAGKDSRINNLLYLLSAITLYLPSFIHRENVANDEDRSYVITQIVRQSFNLEPHRMFTGGLLWDEKEPPHLLFRIEGLLP